MFVKSILWYQVVSRVKFNENDRNGGMFDECKLILDATPNS